MKKKKPSRADRLLEKFKEGVAESQARLNALRRQNKMTREREVEILKTCVEDAVECLVRVRGGWPSSLIVGGDRTMAGVIITLFDIRVSREEDKEWRRKEALPKTQ